MFMPPLPNKKEKKVWYTFLTGFLKLLMEEIYEKEAAWDFSVFQVKWKLHFDNPLNMKFGGPTSYPAPIFRTKSFL